MFKKVLMFAGALASGEESLQEQVQEEITEIALQKKAGSFVPEEIIKKKEDSKEEQLETLQPHPSSENSETQQTGLSQMSGTVIELPWPSQRPLPRLDTNTSTKNNSELTQAIFSPVQPTAQEPHQEPDLKSLPNITEVQKAEITLQKEKQISTPTVKPLTSAVPEEPKPMPVVTPSATNETALIIPQPVAAKQVVKTKINPEDATKIAREILKPLEETTKWTITQKAENTSFNLKYNADIERAKFPNLELLHLLKNLKKNNTWVWLVGQAVTYSTSNREDTSKYYDGKIVFKNIDFGYINFEEKGVQLQTAAITSCRDEEDAYTFIEEIKSRIDQAAITAKNKPKLVIVKGDPYKDSGLNTCVEYHIYDTTGNNKILVTVARHANGPELEAIQAQIAANRKKYLEDGGDDKPQ